MTLTTFKLLLNVSGACGSLFQAVDDVDVAEDKRNKKKLMSNVLETMESGEVLCHQVSGVPKVCSPSMLSAKRNVPEFGFCWSEKTIRKMKEGHSTSQTMNQ